MLISQRISKLETDLQALRQVREAASAEHDRLVSKRYLLEETLASLEEKVAKMKVEATSADWRFRLRSPAVVLSTDISLILALMILGGLVGLTGAIFSAFFLDFIGGRPFLARRKATHD